MGAAKTGMRKPVDYDKKVGACADYLVGKSWQVIEHEWGFPINQVSRWIKKAGFIQRRKIGKI